MRFLQSWSGAFLFVAAMALVAWSGGCSSSNSGGSLDGGIGTHSGGICEPTCDKPCSSDSDCETSTGELCCDYGSAGKACQSAKACPRFCSTDTDCDTTMGQACELISLGGTLKACEAATAGIKLCQSDGDCGSADVCCGIYKQSICEPVNDCPKTCGSSSDCNTQNGEICCTSLAKLDPNLAAGKGLCLNPQYAACPQTCTTSSDCDSMAAPICCDGTCAATCPKACKSDSDCEGQICCSSATANLPPPPGTYSIGPSCKGTPSYTSCQTCGQSRGCGVECAGCTSGPGTCEGTPVYSACSTCPTSECALNNYCTGCTLKTGGTCEGSPLPCVDFSSQTTCKAAGCKWTASGSGGGSCAGTPPACSTYATQTPCQAVSSCFWESTATCMGTITACASLMASQAMCQTQEGCEWQTVSTTCTGSLTPCASLPTQSACQEQSGCIWGN